VCCHWPVSSNGRLPPDVAHGATVLPEAVAKWSGRRAWLIQAARAVRIVGMTLVPSRSARSDLPLQTHDFLSLLSVWPVHLGW